MKSGKYVHFTGVHRVAGGVSLRVNLTSK